MLYHADVGHLQTMLTPKTVEVWLELQKLKKQQATTAKNNFCINLPRM